MADLSDLQAAQSIKVIGADSAGVEQTPVHSTSHGGLHTNLRNNSGTEIGTSGSPLRVDPTGTTTQPINGTVTANAGTNLNTSALALETTQVTQSTRIGDLTETAPGTDTASSGLNGRLQRIAQRLTSIFTALSDKTLFAKLTDGTRDATVKAASVPVDTADTALVVGQSPFNFLAVTTAATITVKSGAGVLHTINICSPANGDLTVYDNTVGSGTIIAILKATNGTSPTCLTFNVRFSTGLTIVSSSASPEWTITYK